jgi:hypothetical protein
MVTGNSSVRLAYNLTIPSSIIVNIDYAISSSIQAASNELIVDAEMGFIQVCSERWNEILPADRESEDVESVIICEVVHLSNAVRTTLG